MNEKPILFNTEMVQAILEGRKTQTRRVVKNVSGNNCIPFKWRSEKTGKMVNGINHVLDKKTLTVCPFGKIGDRLWVRENFKVVSIEEYITSHCFNYDDDADDYCTAVVEYTDGIQKVCEDLYIDTEDNINQPEQANRYHKKKGWTPNIHMPRWACRLELEITGIHVERLQDISEEDATAEGSKPILMSHIEGFRHIWSQTGGNWQENPWVWVIDFKVVEDK